jgi:hypothetical protein
MKAVLILLGSEKNQKSKWISMADETGNVDQVICLSKYNQKIIFDSNPELLLIPSLRSLSDETNQLLRRIDKLLELANLLFLHEALSLQMSNASTKKVLKSLISFNSDVQMIKIQKRVANLQNEKRIGRKPVVLSSFELLELSDPNRQPKLSLKQIGYKLGCSPQTVMRRLKKIKDLERNGVFA